MSSNHFSIKTTRSLKCGIVHEDLGVPRNEIQYENKLIHEHDFITTRVEETNGSLIHCITCGIHYCELCGKALEIQLINHECYCYHHNLFKRGGLIGATL